ncbi:hypothetical protein B0H13DRAFT_2349032 [Mycena leptocephala]|nr:hypothetical protein B0H13DRAFT_2349032 [Mycena leptocephala]
MAHHRSRDGHFNCVGSAVGIQENQVLVQGDQETSGQTGTAGASIALAVLVTFLANKESDVPTGIAYCLGRVYCPTILANLNRRKTGKMGSGRGTSSGASPETRGTVDIRSGAKAAVSMAAFMSTGALWNSHFQEFSIGSFKTNPGQDLPDDSPALEIEMTVNDSASYSSKKKPDLFAP